ncbi:hypothetical protein VE23_04080 [Paenibacillus sp. D9]|nr:hypothetical protein VE23_04080 [Paenibacillus sp. D9]
MRPCPAFSVMNAGGINKAARYGDGAVDEIQIEELQSPEKLDSPPVRTTDGSAVFVQMWHMIVALDRDSFVPPTTSPMIGMPPFLPPASRA